MSFGIPTHKSRFCPVSRHHEVDCSLIEGDDLAFGTAEVQTQAFRQWSGILDILFVRLFVCL